MATFSSWEKQLRGYAYWPCFFLCLIGYQEVSFLPSSFKSFVTFIFFILRWWTEWVWESVLSLCHVGHREGTQVAGLSWWVLSPGFSYVCERLGTDLGSHSCSSTETQSFGACGLAFWSFSFVLLGIAVCVWTHYEDSTDLRFSILLLWGNRCSPTHLNRN